MKDNSLDLMKLVSEEVLTLEEAKASDKLIVYLPTVKGTYKIMKTPFAFLPLLEDPTAIGTETEIPVFEMTHGKIPVTLLLQIQHFFVDVCTEMNSVEAMVCIYWNMEKRRYELHCPEQIVSSGHISYKRNRELELDPNYVLVMDIHSHNNMSAFFSGTDDRDEKETRVFGVMGRVTDVPMQEKYRFGVAGKFTELQRTDIFDSDMKLSPCSVKYPEEWWGKISTRGNSYRVKQSTPLHNGSAKEAEQIKKEIKKEKASLASRLLKKLLRFIGFDK